MMYILAFTTLLLALLSQGDRPRKAKSLIALYFTAGLLVSYVLGIFMVSYQFVEVIRLYATLLTSAGLLVFGIWHFQQFFIYHGVRLTSELRTFSSRLHDLRKQPVPLWLFIALGLIVGAIEPLQYGETVLASGYLWSIFWALLPVLLLTGIVSMGSKDTTSNQARPAWHLVYGGILVLVSWLGALIGSQFIIL